MLQELCALSVEDLDPPMPRAKAKNLLARAAEKLVCGTDMQIVSLVPIPVMFFVRFIVCMCLL